MLWRLVAVEHPNAAFVPRYYVTAATPSTVAQFKPTVGVVVLYPPQLFGVQFAVATSHRKILNLSPALICILGCILTPQNLEIHARILRKRLSIAFSDHGERRTQAAMLGMGRGRVNEHGTPMDAEKVKSGDFRLSQALANRVVRKGVCGDFILCGLSPPVSASWSLVHRYTLWNVQARSRNNAV
jgi:hypothetical protein